MKTIWKFNVTQALIEPITLELPGGYEILSLQVQNGHICFWALVDPEAPKLESRFAIYGTGHDVPAEPGEFIGTVQMFGGNLIWHVFEAS